MQKKHIYIALGVIAIAILGWIIYRSVQGELFQGRLAMQSATQSQTRPPSSPAANNNSTRPYTSPAAQTSNSKTSTSQTALQTESTKPYVSQPAAQTDSTRPYTSPAAAQTDNQPPSTPAADSNQNSPNRPLASPPANPTGNPFISNLTANPASYSLNDILPINFSFQLNGLSTNNATVYANIYSAGGEFIHAFQPKYNAENASVYNYAWNGKKDTQTTTYVTPGRYVFQVYGQEGAINIPMKKVDFEVR